MITDFPLYADGSMLWCVIPTVPSDDNVLFTMFHENVLNVISDVYKLLYENSIDLDAVSLMYIVKQFFTRRLFHDCLEWVKKNINVPKSEIKFMSFVDF